MSAEATEVVLAALGGRLLHQSLMFLGTHVDGLIDEQYRDSVVDSVGLLQPRVVKQVVDQQQRSAVDGAHQDAQKLLVQHGEPGATALWGG